MARDPLAALLRLRKMSVDEARRDLATCLRAETEASEAMAALEAMIDRETEAASSLSADDSDVESFGAWLRRIRPAQRATLAAQNETAAAAVVARGVLAAARAGVRLVEVMLEHEAEEALAETERADQRDIDEAAQRQRGARSLHGVTGEP